jgi:RNA polymerase sigma-70 factor (ECF subfamily)
LNDRSDENLVAASQHGDKSAYALLVKRYYKHVFIVSLGVAGNLEDAEDAAQEAMLKGFIQLRKLKNSSRFGPWITKTARNLSINILRRRQHAKKIIANRTVQLNARPSPNESLRQAIESLPLEIRQPLVMYYFDGQSVQTVASNLNMSTSAVYSRLRSAIKQLHRLLPEQGDIDG